MTASIDSVHFDHPIQLGDVVVLRAQVNRAWRSSMEVGVRVERETGPDSTRHHAVRAYLTFVALDEHGRPRAVAPVEPATEEDQRRYDQADERRRQRLAVRR